MRKILAILFCLAPLTIAASAISPAPVSAGVAFPTTPVGDTFAHEYWHAQPMGQWIKVDARAGGTQSCTQWVKLGNIGSNSTGFGQMKWRSGSCATSGIQVVVLIPGIGLYTMPGPSTMCAVGPNIYPECNQLPDSSLFEAPVNNPAWHIVKIIAWVCTAFAQPVCTETELDPFPA